MRNLLAALSLSAFATVGFAQGTVNSANTAATLFRTNAVWSGGTSGNTANGAPSAGGFLYHVLTAPSTVTSVDASLQGLLSGPWSDTGLNLTNATLASGGRINGPSGTNGQVQNWAPGSFQSYIIVGWSANEGATWAQLAANLLGARFTGSYWDMTGSSSGQWVYGGFIGATTIQAGAAGPPDGSIPFALFGSGPNGLGTPITTPTTLWVVSDPEPSTISLAGLGFGVLVMFRRRKA